MSEVICQKVSRFVALAELFRQGRNTFLTSKALIVNFMSYLSERSKEQIKTFNHFKHFKHYKQPVYSYGMVLFALEIRCMPVQAYKSE